MAAVVFNSIIRLPVVFIAANATLMIGEVARRGFANVICWAMNVQPQPQTAGEPSLRDQIFDLCCPFHKESANRLLISGAICAFLGTIGWELANFGLGPLPPQYNNVSRYIGPLVLDGNWRHPLVVAGLRWFSKA